MSNPISYEEFLKQVLESLSPSDLKQKRKPRPCRIKLNGKFIKTSSGKTLWNNPGFAKNAIIYHVKSLAYSGTLLDKDYKVYYSYLDRCLKEIFNHLEIVEI